MKYVFREIIRILPFFSVSVSCMIEMTMWNIFLVGGGMVDTMADNFDEQD
jgi:hypothetical protein